MLGLINLVIIDSTGIHALNELWTLAILALAVWGVVAVFLVASRAGDRRRHAVDVAALSAQIAAWRAYYQGQQAAIAPPPPPPPEEARK